MKNLFFIAAIILSIAFVFTACSDNKSKAKTEQLAKDEIYTCTMHNEVMSDHPSECPKCGMKLVKQKMTAEQEKMMKEGTYVKPKE
ncbi:heavy metal-binding domain-containing protein [Flavisolibacter nicotianae]|uniref:heavy metal-binding domain-containing protein n=1 Tax=Flavisolibacter nicotianae TaxID=2364882 RepID=UPI000EAD5D0F|nr:heavy metal-binding domain-containing protein [Flavisolibacter nicotianae]